MTRTSEEVTRVLALAERGHSASAISRITDIPRPTVRDWMKGNTPRRRRVAVRPANLPLRYVHLLGLYLGDGYLASHRREVWRLRVALDARYPAIIQDAIESVRAVMPANRVLRQSYGTWVEVSSYSRVWPLLFPQHGSGKKHERRIQFEPWQVSLVERAPELLVRGLLQSDGCRFINTGRAGWRAPRYSFSNRSDDIREIFRAACEQLGLHSTVAPRVVYISRAADVAMLDELVGPKR